MLHTLRQQGTEPAALLTTINETVDRVAMHGVRHSVLRAQAAAAGLPLIAIPLPYPCSNEIYEERMASAVADACAQEFTHIAFGDLFLEDVRRYREERLAGTGLTPIFPLWGRPTDALGLEMIHGGLDARIACVDLRVMPANLAGRATMRPCCASFRKTSIRAVSAASFTRASSAVRCSRTRST